MTTKENAVACVRNRKNYGMYNPNQELLESTGQMAEELGLVGFPVEIMQNYANNDAGNARRFLDVYGEDVRYCAGEKQWRNKLFLYCRISLYLGEYNAILTSQREKPCALQFPTEESITISAEIWIWNTAWMRKSASRRAGIPFNFDIRKQSNGIMP